MGPHDQIASFDCEGRLGVRWNVDDEEFVLVRSENGALSTQACTFKSLRSEEVLTGRSVGRIKAKRGLLWNGQLREIRFVRETALIVRGDRIFPISGQGN